MPENSRGMQEPPEDLERSATEILNATMALSDEEVIRLYAASRPGEDPRLRVHEFCRQAHTLYSSSGRVEPEQLRVVLAAAAQLELPISSSSEARPPRVLIVDRDPDRVLARKKVFSDGHVVAEVATSPSDALDKLAKGEYRFVIIDFQPRTEDERSCLVLLQRFNLQIPLINVQAWAGLLGDGARRLDRDLLRVAARLFRKPVPKSLPKKRPPRSAAASLDEPAEFRSLSSNPERRFSR
jgi:CheY-like chemotaxis protein